MENMIEELREAVFNCDKERAESAARKALEIGIDPYKAIMEGLTPAINEMGRRFEKGEVFLPHLVMAGDAMTAAINILEKEMSKEKLRTTRKGKIVIGTVKGDVHDIGKSIVAIMFKAAGYEVIDLGVEVEPSKFIEEAERSEADIIAASALMTNTATNMKVINEYMKMEGVREKYRLIFGGGPLSANWAKEMGADGYARDAIKAVELVNQLMSGEKDNLESKQI